jgi:hypothetical protein
MYAWTEYRRSPVVALLSVFVTTAGLYFVHLHAGPDAIERWRALIGAGDLGGVLAKF